MLGLAAYLALLVVRALAAVPRRARPSPARAVVAAAFAALVVHTMLYAAFLEDPLTWTLLAVGTALAVAAARSAPARRRPAQVPEPADADRAQASAKA